MKKKEEKIEKPEAQPDAKKGKAEWGDVYQKLSDNWDKLNPKKKTRPNAMPVARGIGFGYVPDWSGDDGGGGE